MKVMVTGATGYIGTHFTALAASCKNDVTVASRRQPESGTVSWLPYDLKSCESIDLPLDTDVVVHLAANTVTTNRLDDDIEVAAAQVLIDATQKAGAKFIFVSSQTARADAPTSYGRVKWRIEQEVITAGGVVVRPGLVYGGELRGLYGTLVNTVSKLPLLPAFIPPPKVQPIHVDDLASILLSISGRDDINSGVYFLADPQPVSFSLFLAEIARSRLRCRRFFVPTPVIAVAFFIEIMGSAWRKRLDLGRLFSLFDLPEMKTVTDLDRLDVTLRSLSTGLHPSGDDRRRCLLREGQALLAYVLKERPGGVTLRLYVRAIERLRGGQAMELPGIFLSYPILLSLLDKKSFSTEALRIEFIWRLDAATVLAEASPMGAVRFLGLGYGHGLLHSLFLLTNAVAGEMFWRLGRLFVSPILRFSRVKTKDVL